MPIALPDLPYSPAALEPHLSRATVELHYRGHHGGHLEALNRLLPGSGLDELPLEEIVRRASGRLFEEAAQAWNHAFYWNCMMPRGGGDPSGRIATLIVGQFGDVLRFREEFERMALGLTGSGWIWLVQRADGSLGLVVTPNAGTPLTGSDVPVLACDLWEHAYYLDRQNARGDYLKAWWAVVDWNAANKRLR